MDFLQLTIKEASLLDQLRDHLSDVLDTEYQRSNPYLITWLRSRNHDLVKAAFALRETIEWRKVHGIDTLLEEKLDLPKEFKVDSCIARDGRPVFILPEVGKCDFKEQLELGKRESVIKYIYQGMETAESLLEKNFEANIHVSQYSALIDVGGFSYKNFISAKCISVFTEMAQVGEKNWPLRANEIYLINAPKVVKLIMKLLAPFLSQNSIGAIRFLDSNNKVELRDQLLQFISKEQLPKYFGGEKVV